MGYPLRFRYGEPGQFTSATPCIRFSSPDHVCGRSTYKVYSGNLPVVYVRHIYVREELPRVPPSDYFMASKRATEHESASDLTIYYANTLAAVCNIRSLYIGGADNDIVYIIVSSALQPHRRPHASCETAVRRCQSDWDDRFRLDPPMSRSRIPGYNPEMYPFVQRAATV